MPLRVAIDHAGAEAIVALPTAKWSSVVGGITAQNVNVIWGRLQSSIVPDQNNWRIDRQNPTATHANIQVQRNGITGAKSTIACILVPVTLNVARPASTPETEANVNVVYNARQSELAKAVRSGLTQSGNSYVPGPSGKPGTITVYKVEGEFSA